MAPSHVTPGLAIDTTPASPSEVPRLIGPSQIRSDQDQIRPGQDGRVSWSRRRSAHCARRSLALQLPAGRISQTDFPCLQLLLDLEVAVAGDGTLLLCSVGQDGRRSFRRCRMRLVSGRAATVGGTQSEIVRGRAACIGR